MHKYWKLINASGGKTWFIIWEEYSRIYRVNNVVPHYGKNESQCSGYVDRLNEATDKAILTEVTGLIYQTMKL